MVTKLRRHLTRKQIKYFGTRRQKAALHIRTPKKSQSVRVKSKKKTAKKKSGSSVLPTILAGVGGFAAGTATGVVLSDPIKQTLENAKNWIEGKLGLTPSQGAAVQQGAQIVTTPSGDKIPIFSNSGAPANLAMPPVISPIVQGTFTQVSAAPGVNGAQLMDYIADPSIQAVNKLISQTQQGLITQLNDLSPEAIAQDWLTTVPTDTPSEVYQDFWNQYT